jgi:hypothetical protein
MEVQKLTRVATSQGARQARQRAFDKTGGV